MKILVSYSGGKDSQAALIYASKLYNNADIEAVFCDTGFESELTYKHIIDTTSQLNIKLIVLKNKKYSGLIDLAKQKKRFPSVMRRFCTSELKVKPMIDYLLSLNDNVLIFQGIRANESVSRSKLQNSCDYFKYYHKPSDNSYKPHTYRRKEVLNKSKLFSFEIIRPFFYDSSMDVIKYILDNNQFPNPLYYKGFKRVGCYPCILSSLSEINNLITIDYDRFQFIKNIEHILYSTFFPTDKIPERFRSGISLSSNKLYTTAYDIEKYLSCKHSTLDLFAEQKLSCNSFYNLCE